MKQFFTRLKIWLSPPKFADEEKTRLARIVHYLHMALILTSIFSILADAHLTTTIILIIGNTFILVVYFINRRGYPRAAGLILLTFFLFVLACLLLFGSGIHDIAVTALPVLLIMSALILDRRGVIVFAFLVIATTALIIYSETVGIPGIQMRPQQKTDWSDFVIISSILAAAAFSSHILIDQLVKSLERSRLSEARVLSLVENSPDFIYEIDRSGKILFTNKRSEEFLGKNIKEVLASTQIELALEQIEKAFGTGQSQSFELQTTTLDGNSEWSLIRLAPVKRGDAVSSLTVIGTNITSQKSTESALKISEERYRLISTVTSDYMFSSRRNSEGKMVMNWVAGAFETMTGYTVKEYVEKGGWVATLHPDEIEHDQRDMDVLGSNQPITTEIRTVMKNGQVRWVRVYAHPAWDPVEQKLVGVYGAVQDITERKQADEKIRQTANQLATLNEIGRAVAVLADLDSVLETIHKQVERIMPLDAFFVTLYNPETKMLSYPLVYDQGKRWYEPDSPLQPDTHTSYVIQTGKSILRLFTEEELESDRLHPPVLIGDESKISASMVFVPMFIKDKTIGVLSAQTYTLNAYNDEHLSLLEGVANQVAIAIENARLFTNIQQELAERKRAEERLAYDALHDALTGLPNRILFNDRLSQKLEHARRHPKSLFAVLFIDLDRFKVVNDSLGHVVGDQLLVETAHRLSQCMRPEDTVSRLSGDEFAILLNDFKDVSDAVRVAERIQAALTSTSMIVNFDRITSASIGIVVYNGKYTTPQEMLRDADSAMYRAKAMGRGQYKIFDDTMYASALALLRLEADLKSALVNQEFRVYYQPIITLPERKIIGVEALVRWEHPERGIISPLEFIDVAEESGLILPIGEFVLREACIQTMKWRTSKNSDLWVSVNLSARQFQDQNLLGTIRQALENSGLPGESLQLEITESVAMNDFAFNNRILESLNQIGIQISLDDFGIGYSSLSYLNRFPIRVIKIDRSFIHEVGKNNNNAAITTAIISMSHALNMLVVAEGVESEEELACLQLMDCDKIQGFLISRPLPAEQLEALL